MSDSLANAASRVDTICLIDDSDDEAFLAQRLLKRENIQVTVESFHSLEQFNEYTASHPNFSTAHAMLIVDLYLGIDLGTDVIPRITATYPGLIVGMSTGSCDPGDQDKAMESGAWFYVGKPLDHACLESICNQVDTLSLATSDSGAFLLRG